MGLILKLGNLFVGKPLAWLNLLLDGKKTYLGAALLILPGLVCLIQTTLDLFPLDLNDLVKLAKSSCIRQIGEGLAFVGGAHKLAKLTNTRI